MGSDILSSYRRSSSESDDSGLGCAGCGFSASFVFPIGSSTQQVW